MLLLFMPGSSSCWRSSKHGFFTLKMHKNESPVILDLCFTQVRPWLLKAPYSICFPSTPNVSRFKFLHFERVFETLRFQDAVAWTAYVFDFSGAVSLCVLVSVRTAYVIATPLKSEQFDSVVIKCVEIAYKSG